MREPPEPPQASKVSASVRPPAPGMVATMPRTSMPHVVGLRPAYLAATAEGGEPALAVGVGGESGMRVGCSVGSAGGWALGSTLFGLLLVVVDVDDAGASLAVVETGGALRVSVAVQAASAPRGTAARKARRSTVAHGNGGRWEPAANRLRLSVPDGRLAFS
jgi:hypothetical protein